jgi:hypothetical protein
VIALTVLQENLMSHLCEELLAEDSSAIEVIGIEIPGSRKMHTSEETGRSTYAHRNKQD